MPRVEVSKLHSFGGHGDCIYTLQALDGGPVFFSGGGDGMVVKWDLTNPDEGSLIARLPNSIYAMHLHAASGILVAGHNYEGVHLIDWIKKEEIASRQLTTSAVFDIQSLGSNLFVAAGDGTVSCVHIGDLAVKSKANLSSKSARTLAIHQEQGELAVGYSDNYVRILDLDSLQEKLSWRAHANSVFCARYSPDGSQLFTVSRDARVKGWDVRAGYKQVFEVIAHMYAINSLDFSPDGKHFVTCSMDKSIKVWDLEHLKLLKVIDKARHAGHGTSVNRVLWMAFNDRLVSAGDDRQIAVWDVNFLN